MRLWPTWRGVRKAIVEPLIIGVRVECQNAIVKHSRRSRRLFEQQSELNVFIDTTFLTFLFFLFRPRWIADQSFDFDFGLGYGRALNEILVTCWTFICSALCSGNGIRTKTGIAERREGFFN
jgi:hypothetical protein